MNHQYQQSLNPSSSQLGRIWSKFTFFAPVPLSANSEMDDVSYYDNRLSSSQVILIMPVLLLFGRCFSLLTNVDHSEY